MPSTLVSIRKARSPQERRALAEAVHAALVEALKAPDHDRTVRVQAFAAEDFLVGAGASEHYTLVEVTLYPGRGLEAKRAFYQSLLRRLGAFGVTAGDLKVILHEVPPDNWGLRGVPGSDAARPKTMEA